jgi:superfamily II DNA or RNA helicase
MKLRAYQKEIIDLFERDEKSFLVQIPTGGGKSFVMSTITKIASSRGERVLIIMNGTSLVHQMSQNLTKFRIGHGIVQASEFSNERVHVCSVDTLTRRVYPETDLIIIDEAHRAISKGWRALIGYYQNIRKISFTATPFTKESLEHLAEKIVMPVDYNELVKENFLVKMRTFVPKTLLDLSSIKKRGGDYDEVEVFKQLDREPQYRDLFANYEKYLSSRPTLCFAVNIQHAKNIANYFTERGVKTAFIEANTPLEERNYLLGALKSRDIKIISSVGTLTTGIDVPPVSGLLIARPTLSKILHIQMLGRGSRICEGKEDCIVLDLVENTKKNGFIDAAGIGWLKYKKSKVGEQKKRICPQCSSLVPLSRAKDCPECSYTFEEKKFEHEIKKSLSGVEPLISMREIEDVEAENLANLEELIKKGMRSKYKEGWVYIQAVKSMGKEFAKRHLRFNSIYQDFSSRGLKQ